MLISGLIRTYNEADNLRTSLPNWARFVDEMVVSDGGSTDNTRGVAESVLGDKLVWLNFPGGSIHEAIHQNHAGKQLNYGLDYCSGEWVITYDADAIFCPRFIHGIRGILESAKYDAYVLFGAHIVDDWDYYIDDMMNGPGMIQVFRRSTGARFPNRPEEAAYVTGFDDEKVGVLNLGIYHWGYMDREKHQAKRVKRTEVFKGTELGPVFEAALKHGTNWKRRKIPWHMCHENCASCWMVERAKERRESMW